MQTNPTKDSDLNISVHNYDGLKFRDLRQKAQEEFNERGKRRKKDKKVVLPEFKIGDNVVTFRRWENDYIYTEIVDFSVYKNEVVYYGIVIKVSNPEMKGRIGRLCKFSQDKGSWIGSDFSSTNYKESDIKKWAD